MTNPVPSDIKRRELLAAAGAGIALLVAPRKLHAQEDSAKIRVGIMGPFTGPAARTGGAFKKGAQMALEDARKDNDLVCIWPKY